MRYTEEERALLSNPYCPMMMAGSGHCVKDQCAWWDSVEERCAVYSIAQLLGRMQEEMKISNGG